MGLVFSVVAVVVVVVVYFPDFDTKSKLSPYFKYMAYTYIYIYIYSSSQFHA